MWRTFSKLPSWQVDKKKSRSSWLESQMLILWISLWEENVEEHRTKSPRILSMERTIQVQGCLLPWMFGAVIYVLFSAWRCLSHLITLSHHIAGYRTASQLFLFHSFPYHVISSHPIPFNFIPLHPTPFHCRPLSPISSYPISPLSILSHSTPSHPILFLFFPSFSILCHPI